MARMPKPSQSQNPPTPRFVPKMGQKERITKPFLSSRQNLSSPPQGNFNIPYKVISSLRLKFMGLIYA